MPSQTPSSPPGPGDRGGAQHHRRRRPRHDPQVIGVKPRTHGERLRGDDDLHAGDLDFTHRHLQNGAVDPVAANRRRQDGHEHDDQSAVLLLHGVSVRASLLSRFA